MLVLEVLGKERPCYRLSPTPAGTHPAGKEGA